MNYRVSRSVTYALFLGGAFALPVWITAGCRGPVPAPCPREVTRPPPSRPARAVRRTRPPPVTPAPRRVAWTFGGPCWRTAQKAPAGRAAVQRPLRAQRVIAVDRRSPHWVPLAQKHIASTGGCVGCRTIGRTWKPPTVGFHVHLRAAGALLVNGRAVPLSALAWAVQECFNMLDSAGVHVLLTVAPSRRRAAGLTAVLQRLLNPGVSVHLYANRP